MKIKILIGLVFSFILIWAIGTAAVAQEGTSSNNTTPQNPFAWDDVDALAAGKQVYLFSCQGCHGAFGNNIESADMSTRSHALSIANRPDIFFWIISEGLTGGGMPGYQSTLSEKQIWQVVTYLRTLGTGTTTPPTTTQPVLPKLEHGVLPDCFRCHTRILSGHDVLGTGSAACLVCHSSTTMGQFKLLDGTEISSSDSPKLCGQCHADRYAAWQTGTHGILSRDSGASGIPTTVTPKCVDCHEPHSPQLSLATGNIIPSVASGEEGKLDCLSCHVRTLHGHDQLGTGSEACWSCHLSTEMTTFHLAGGDTRLSASESTRLCAQCHQQRFQAWNEGTHGVPAWKEGEPQLFGSEKVPCINCHEPHQPQVRLINITKPHPEPAPEPPKPPYQLLAIVGISILVTAGLGFVVMRGEG